MSQESTLVERRPAENILSFDSHKENVLNVDALLFRRQDLFSRRLEFREAQKPDTHHEDLHRKYITTNGIKTTSLPFSPKLTKNGVDAKRTDTPNRRHASGFEEPAFVLYARAKINQWMTWQTMHRVGPGLSNLGNTCFLNTVLQCLTYCPPLTNYLLSNEHTSACKWKSQNSFCALCAMSSHVKSALSSSSPSSTRALTPKPFIAHLRLIASHFRQGRQEDAHEFTRYLIDAFQKSALQGHDQQLHARIKETTVIHQIFGGHLQSQVKCCECHHESNTFDFFLDLSLDIQRASSLEKALSTFIDIDHLTGDNRYQCASCQKRVNAKKQMTIYSFPSVLTIQLKRFNYSHHSGKIARFISFPLQLDLLPYASQPSSASQSAHYELFAVAVHAGMSCGSGHYYAYVKPPAGVWYCMDDESVRQVSQDHVLAQSAYMLFYVKKDTVHRKESITPSKSPSDGMTSSLFPFSSTLFPKQQQSSTMTSTVPGVPRQEPPKTVPVSSPVLLTRPSTATPKPSNTHSDLSRNATPTQVSLTKKQQPIQHTAVERLKGKKTTLPTWEIRSSQEAAEEEEEEEEKEKEKTKESSQEKVISSPSPWVTTSKLTSKLTSKPTHRSEDNEQPSLPLFSSSRQKVIRVGDTDDFLRMVDEEKQSRTTKPSAVNKVQRRTPSWTVAEVEPQREGYSYDQIVEDERPSLPGKRLNRYDEQYDMGKVSKAQRKRQAAEEGVGGTGVQTRRHASTSRDSSTLVSMKNALHQAYLSAKPSKQPQEEGNADVYASKRRRRRHDRPLSTGSDDDELP